MDDTRFAFGKNWRSFLDSVTAGQLEEARQSLCRTLGVTTLEGKRFLDIGCGSGIFSLGARKLGAEVVSFDYDPDSVRCAESLRDHFLPGSDGGWRILRGSALDEQFLRDLGLFDIVYSWGVLHHTGDMWRALDLAALPVKQGGVLFISIYNDQAMLSRIWTWVKRFYNSSAIGRWLMLILFLPVLTVLGIVADLSKGRNPLDRYRRYGRGDRGMSLWHDHIDWIGGYPFEVASPAAVFRFYRDRGFQLIELKTTNGWGTNEFVFLKVG